MQITTKTLTLMDQNTVKSQQFPNFFITQLIRYWYWYHLCLERIYVYSIPTIRTLKTIMNKFADG